MYLENSEQGIVSREGEQSTEVKLTEQCQLPKVPEAADLTSPSKRSAEPGIDAPVEYAEQTINSREMEPSFLYVKRCNMNRDETESCTYCNRHSENFEQYSASDDFFESDQIVDKCETTGLSQSFDECIQHRECFKPCKSSEHCANHRLASKCCPCCEHCAEDLQLFQQCKPSDQQFNLEPDKLPVNCCGFWQCEMSNFIPESTGHLELLQQYESSGQQHECFDCEPDTSIKDSEQCNMTGFTPNILDSGDSLVCETELCEDVEIRNQSECSEDDNKENCPTEQDKAEPINVEFGRLSLSHFATPGHVYLDDSEASESCETHKLMAENYQEAKTSRGHCEMCESYYSETSQECEPTLQCAASEQCNSDKTSDFFSEEDGSSECSSVETKSFKTCHDGSIPSDPCSYSSGESEKGAQEDSSDEQMQWESFEDDEEIEQSLINTSNEDTKKTPTVDIVIEDYFDLFDRADYYGHTFAPKQHYISCFDGGDINAFLYLEQLHFESQKLSRNAYKCEEINEEMYVQETDASSKAPKEACEDPYKEYLSSRDDASSGSHESDKQHDDWIFESDSNLAEDEAEYEESEDDACVFHGHVFEICNEKEANFTLSSSNQENMYEPFTNDISVGGDAYEEKVPCDQNSDSLGKNTSTVRHLQTTVIDTKKEDKEKSEDEEFIAYSEMEPYWSLVYHAGNEERCDPGVEEYYAYQIKSIQSNKNSLNGLNLSGLMDINKKTLHKDQIIHGKDEENASGNEGEDAVLSLTELKAHDHSSPEECKAITFGITQVVDLSGNVANHSTVENVANEQTPESDDDCGNRDNSKELDRPSDIIHNIVSEFANSQEGDTDKDSEQSKDSEEEQSDDESSESCECEYCILPIEQVSAKPLLPQMESSDAGKICVVIDLDETLVHSSFKPVHNADFIIPVEIDGMVHQVYVLKRPHVDEFLKRMGEMFECVLFTASLSKYADPVSDMLDKWGAFRSRLFRESCVFHKGNYIKDLSHLGRDLNKVIIIDNSPASYIFHPENAVPVVSWFDDMSDTELLDLIPFFERLSKVDDIYAFLTQQRTSS